MATEDIAAKSAGILIIMQILNKNTGQPVNLSTATVMEFRIKPRHSKGVVKKITASFLTTGTDGKIKFTTTVLSFDAPGDWNVQGYVALTGYTGYTTAVIIKVLEILEMA